MTSHRRGTALGRGLIAPARLLAVCYQFLFQSRQPCTASSESCKRQPIRGNAHEHLSSWGVVSISPGSALSSLPRPSIYQHTRPRMTARSIDSLGVSTAEISSHDFIKQMSQDRIRMSGAIDEMNSRDTVAPGSE
jgi:hypothetical protein